MNIFDGKIGHIRIRLVIKHQEDAGDHENEKARDRPIPSPQVVDQRKLQRCARTGWRWRKTLPKTNVERVRSEVAFPVRNMVSFKRRGTALRFSMKRSTADPFLVCAFGAT